MIVDVIDVEDEHEWSQYSTLRDSRFDWSLLRALPVYHDFLSATDKPVFQPSHSTVSVLYIIQ